MQQGSLIRSSRKRGPDVWQFRWADRGPYGKRIYRKRLIGTVCEYPDAESARTSVKALLREVNSNPLQRFPPPMTVAEVCEHFTQRELANDNLWRSYSTKRAYKTYLKKWIVPHWGAARLSEIRTMKVESWLRQLPLPKSSCAKIRGLLSVVFNHACRHEFFERNPIRLVRQGAKRRSAPTLLTPPEIKALINGLGLRERTLVLLVAFTGLRQSELFGLKSGDINLAQGTMNVTRSIVCGVVGPCKTESSQKPMPVQPIVWMHSRNGGKAPDIRTPMTGFSRADATGVESQSGVRQSCASSFVPSHSGSGFRSDSDGTRSGTHSRRCCEASEQNSKSCRSC
jgi:integrase